MKAERGTLEQARFPVRNLQDPINQFEAASDRYRLVGTLRLEDLQSNRSQQKA
ncbi:MAG: hypothetical protein ACLFU2_06205 [Opitutales bacterium]